MRFVIALLVGSLLGFIGSKILFVGSALSLIPWGLIGLANGMYARNKKESMFSGAVYGFFLTLIFMISGYNGQRPIFIVLPFFILLGFFGAFCGLLLGIIGFLLKRFLKK